MDESSLKRGNRAVVVMPYYGKLPPYFGFYLKSVKGKCFDVLFVTDLDVGEHPSNVRIVKMAFGDVITLASQKLGLHVRMENPKRLCNFRPMYGKIFEDYIKDYDYWGYGDCDLVYGNKMSSVLEKVLNGQHDVISFRKYWTSGPTCFVQNGDKTNLLFMRAKNWRDVATMNEAGNPLFFDEVGGAFHLDLQAGSTTIGDCEKIRDSFCAVASRSADIDYSHEDVLFEENISGSYVHMRSNGCLYAGEEEIPCFHYIGIKFRRYFTYVNSHYCDVGEYWIDETGFYPTRALWRLRRIINPCRKIRALIASLRENGIHHWIRRLAK